MDLIGQLGLDSSHFESALDRIGKKLGQSARDAEGFSQTILAAAAAIAIWSRNILDAKERADQLDKAITAVAKSVGKSEFTSESALETRLKEVNSLLDKLSAKKPPSDVMIEKVSDFFKSPENRSDAKEQRALDDAVAKRTEIEEKLAEKKAAQNEILQLQLDGETELAELKKNQIKYDELIRESQKGTNVGLTEQLKIEKELTDEIIRQKRDKQEADELAKQEAEDAEHLREQYEKEQEEAAKQREARLKSERDLEEDLAKQRKKDLEEQIAAGNELYKQAQEKLKILKEIQAENEKITSELHGQSTMQEIQSSSDRGIAQTSRDFDQRIAGQLERGNFEGAAELEFQKDNALRGDKVRRGNETASDRKAERKRKREEDRAIKRSDKRDADLERRLNQTIKDGLDPDQVPQDVKDFAKRKYDESINKIDKDKAKEDGGKQRAAWSQSDSQNLQKCAAALTPKD